MHQHDIQEFLMQLLNAVEVSFEQNGQFGVIDELYQGINNDYIRCKNCGFESKRDSKFFDMQLPISNPFENIQNTSIEQALKGLLDIEVLTGDNKYLCPQCQSKQDAEKGMKFGKVPKILMLQLQRFTIDYQTFNRKKLNDEVTFPLILNVNPFLDKDQIQNDAFLAQLIEDNPLAKVKKMMEKPKPFGRVQKKKVAPSNTSTSLSTAATIPTGTDGGSETHMNATELEFHRQLEEEAANTVDQEMFDQKTGKQLTKLQQ